MFIRVGPLCTVLMKERSWTVGIYMYMTCKYLDKINSTYDISASLFIACVKR